MSTDSFEQKVRIEKQEERMLLLISILHSKHILNTWEAEKLEEISDARALEHIEK